MIRLIWQAGLSICVSIHIYAATEPYNAPANIRFGVISVLSTGEINTDSLSINAHFSAQVVSVNSYKELTSNLLALPLENGYLYPILSLRAVNPLTTPEGVTLNPVFGLEWGERVTIDTVIFEGTERTAPELFRRESRNLLGQAVNPKIISAFLSNFSRYSFLKVQSQTEVVKTREGKYGLLVRVAEHSTNEFSGVVGYVPPKSDVDGYFTGEVKINLNNISGRGRSLNIYWAKPNRLSQQVDLKYFEPWILTTDYSAEGEFRQILRDTLVVIREFDAGIGHRFFRKGSVTMNFNYETTLPTPGGRQLLGLTDLTVRGLGLKGSYDGRDYPVNPTGGILIAGNSYFGRRFDQSTGRLWQYQFETNGEFVYLLRPKWVAACDWNYKAKWLSESAPVYSDWYWFGGARSLRGYPNELFGGREIAWLNNELRWLIGKNGRAHFFFDQGYYRLPVPGPDRRSYPNSYGIGLRLDSRMGIIGIDYGFGRGDTFSTAKIHVFLESSF
ncbi:MAG: BamA/TamA family outer membrane protein [Candidatus Neomarinimicrobiota bacterium]